MSSSVLQMILFSGRKNFVPWYHLVFHGKVPYAEETDFIFVTKNLDRLSIRQLCTCLKA